MSENEKKKKNENNAKNTLLTSFDIEKSGTPRDLRTLIFFRYLQNKTKYKSFWKKVVKKTNDLLEEKLQIIENNIKIEINEIRVELNNFKIQNGIDITILKEIVSNIEEDQAFSSREYGTQKEKIRELINCCIGRVLATVKNSVVNTVFPILPTVQLPNLCFPNT